MEPLQHASLLWRGFSKIFFAFYILMLTASVRFLVTDPEVRVRFPALPECLRSSESETGPFIFVSTTEELLGRKSSSSGLENRDYGRRDPPRWPYDTPLSAKFALALSTRGGRSVGIVRSRTKATELLYSDGVSFIMLSLATEWYDSHYWPFSCPFVRPSQVAIQLSYRVHDSYYEQ
jgi:hypothetical protein